MLTSLPRRLALALFALALAGCESATQAGEAELDITWLTQNAVPFATTTPGTDLGDLAPFGPMVGDARIVGLGEATHGTREFFRMKHRLVEYLVREKGFNTFGIEATWAEANRVNAFIHGGEGDVGLLVSHLRFWTWNTREVVELIEWMRAHNANPGNAPRVSFYGIDMQHARVAMNDVVAYVAGMDAAAGDSVRQHYRCFRVYQDTFYVPIPRYTSAPAATRAECRAGVQAVHAMLQRREGEFVGRSGRAAYEMGVQAARIVVQNEHLKATPTTAVRDAYMAENAAWLARDPSAKVVLWAHNAHVSRWEPFMGTHLTARFGAAYRPVGFAFYQGRLSAVVPGRGVLVTRAGPAVPTSYEHQFHRVGEPLFMVDLRPLRSGAPAGADWMLGPRSFRLIGASYNAGEPLRYYQQRPLASDYDILIWVDESTATVRLPFRFD